MAQAPNQAPQWQQGDRVQFVLGGPIMVVVGPVRTLRNATADEIDCIWFTADGVCRRESFPPALLTPAK